VIAHVGGVPVEEILLPSAHKTSQATAYEMTGTNAQAVA